MAAAGVGEAVSGAGVLALSGAGFWGRGPARVASEGVAVGEGTGAAGSAEAEGATEAVSVEGAGAADAAVSGAGAGVSDAGAEISGATDFGSGDAATVSVGVGIAAGSLFSEPGAGAVSAVLGGVVTAKVDSQVGSGRRFDQTQSPALSATQKITSLVMGSLMNLYMHLISLFGGLDSQAKFFCSFNLDP